MKKESKEVDIKLSDTQNAFLSEGARVADQLNEKLIVQRKANDQLLSLILDSKGLKLADIDEKSIQYLADEKLLKFKLKP